MTAEPDLLPCPWCGEKLASVSVSEGSTFRWRKVDGCCADGPEVRHNTMADDQDAAEVESRTAAIAAWNTRANLAELQREVATWKGLHASEVQVRQRWQARAEALRAEVERLVLEVEAHHAARLRSIAHAERHCARAERLAEALRLISKQGTHYGPDGTRESWQHWAEIARAALEQEEGRHG